MDSHFAGSNQAAADITSQDLGQKMTSLIAEDKKSVGLVGATICFTPEPSPRSSPNMECVRGDLTCIGSLESNDYISSLKGYSMGGSGVEGAANRMTSSAEQIASSLDGRSTTEYEILDEISSKRTIDVSYLSLDEESAISILPSINSGQDQDNNRGLPFATSPLKMLYKEKFGEEQSLVLDDFTADREAKDGNSTSTPSKVDERLLTLFNKVFKLWEGKSTVPGVMGRIVGSEISQGAANSEESNVNETRNSGQQSSSRTSKPLSKMKEAIICITTSKMSFIVSASTFVRILLLWSIGHILSIVKIFAQFWLRTSRGPITPNKIELCPPQNEVNDTTVGAEDPSGLTGTDLSKLFFIEALSEKNIVGTLEESVHRIHPEEHEDESVVTLDLFVSAILKTMNDEDNASIVTKCKLVMSTMKVAANRFLAFSSSLFICVMLVRFSMLLPAINVLWKSMNDVSFEVDNLYCVSTKTSSLMSIPLGELILSPMHFNAEEVVYDDASDGVGPRSWLSAMVIFSTVSSLACAFIIKSKLPSPSTKPKIIIGIWSELEHLQFLEGYNVHGGHWKLVCEFVPTRTYTQVRAHGCYWLKINSPVRMKKARRQDLPTSESPSSVSSSISTPKKSNRMTAVVTPKGILCVKDENGLRKPHVTPKSEERKSKMRQMQGSKSDPVKRVKVVSR